MKREDGVILLRLLLFSMIHAGGTSPSRPGKPTLTSCRSPEKETFTCWWEPGSDGGLPTTYALFYRKENSDKVYECPNYHAAGKNSCFFNKNDTSIWVNYNITVVATNKLGSTYSDPVDIDVVYIVKPNPPENLRVAVTEDKSWPFLRVSWDSPRKADTRSGWITLIYEIRIKSKGEYAWETHHAGQQKVFNIFSLRSGGTYILQVRCKPVHGFWSEWSSRAYIEVPDYFQREKSVWIIFSVFFASIFLFLSWMIHMNSDNLKHCLLPPVPGPKIKGFDEELLKNGNSDDAFSPLGLSDLPATTTSTYEDFLVEFLEVYVPEERELSLEENKDRHDSSLKSESSVSDSDSGHGSCDSHTLLIDKCDEAKQDSWQSERRGGQTEAEAQRNEESPEETRAHDEVVMLNMSTGRGKTWPSVFYSLPRFGSGPLDQASSLQTAKRHFLSEPLFPLATFLGGPGPSTAKGHRPNNWDLGFGDKQADARQLLLGHSDVNVSKIGLQLPPYRSNEYVEVQRVNAEDMVILRPVPPGHGKHLVDMSQEEDYSKVKGVDSDSMILLVKEDETEMCPYDTQQPSGVAASGYPASVIATQPKGCSHSALPTVEERAVSGYVDTNAMFMMPSY
ncbi:prolactin receptor a [Cololabis saira]|uniref:prolactin receptor a n=1 Tax=Cololabis saira TaxID=129043 RepID=UPI002AD54B51|nr:prolactin receptor a [Cololabis saira]